MVAFLIYVVIQASSWYLIILLTTQSSQIQQRIAANAALLAPYVSTLVPAVVTIINSILPTVIALLTKLEKWDDVGFSIKAMVTRLYLAKILNVLIQLFSYALLLNPYLLTSTQTIAGSLTLDGSKVRRNVMLEFKAGTFECRAEQVSSGLLTLVITDFTISKITGIAVPVASVVVMQLRVLWHHLQVKRKRTASQSAIIAPMTEDEQPPLPPRADTQLSEAKPSSTLSNNGMASTVSRTTSSLSTVGTKSEFLVPQKMVALLYSCTIALLSIPLAPTTAILALGLHVVTFKFEKLYLMVGSLGLCVWCVESGSY